MKFTDDLHAPLPAKVEQPQAPTRTLPSGTVRQDADNLNGPWLNLYGQLVHTRPNIFKPTYPAGPPEAPTKPDPTTKTHRYNPSADAGSYRVLGGRVQNLKTGEYVDGKMEPQQGGFSTLCAKMTSHKLG